MTLVWITIGVALGMIVQWFLYLPRRMKGLHYQLTTDKEQVEEGGSFHMEQTVLNRTLLPFSQVKLVARVTDGLAAEPQSFVKGVERYLPFQTYLLWRQRLRRRQTLYALKRGVQHIYLSELSYWDALMINRHKLPRAAQEMLVVYPRCYALDAMLTPPASTLGDIFVKRWIQEDVFFPVGVRDYAPGDNIRYVDWNKTAATGALKSRIFDYTSEEELVLILNLQRNVPEESEFAREAAIERSISMVASLVRAAAKEGYRIGLYANGGCQGMEGQTLRVRPDLYRGEGDLMERLARINNFSTQHFARFIDEAAPELSADANVIAVTSFLNGEIADALWALKGRVRALELMATDAVDDALTPWLAVRHMAVEELPPLVKEEEKGVKASA